MKFKELMNLVDDVEQIRVKIKVYGITFISTHYKDFRTAKEYEPLLEKDIVRIGAIDDYLTVTLK